MSLSKSRQTKVRQLMRQYLHNVGQLCVALDKEEKWLGDLKSRGLAFECSKGLLIRGVDDPIKKVKVKR